MINATSNKNILVIIDMQNSFINPKGKLYIKNSEHLINSTNQYLSQIPKDFFDCLIYTQDTHFADTYHLYEESKAFPLHCEFKSSDWEMAISIQSIENKIKNIYCLHKDTYDMWSKPNQHNKHDLMYKIINHKTQNVDFDTIEELMKHYPNGNTNVFLLGVASDYCNKDAVIGFLKREYNTKILQKFTQGIEKDTIITIENDIFLCYCINKGLLHLVD